MKIIVCENYEEMSKEGAKIIADLLKTEEPPMRSGSGYRLHTGRDVQGACRYEQGRRNLF